MAKSMFFADFLTCSTTMYWLGSPQIFTDWWYTYPYENMKVSWDGYGCILKLDSCILNLRFWNWWGKEFMASVWNWSGEGKEMWTWICGKCLKFRRSLISLNKTCAIENNTNNTTCPSNPSQRRYVKEFPLRFLRFIFGCLLVLLALLHAVQDVLHSQPSALLWHLCRSARPQGHRQQFASPQHACESGRRAGPWRWLCLHGGTGWWAHGNKLQALWTSLVQDGFCRASCDSEDDAWMWSFGGGGLENDLESRQGGFCREGCDLSVAQDEMRNYRSCVIGVPEE